MKTIFKKGDKVYDSMLGWGEIINFNYLKWYFEVLFDTGTSIYYDENGALYDYENRNQFKPTLSFTEYTLEGFSLERPETLPKLGDIVWGKGFHNTDWSIGHYLGKQHASYKISNTPNELSYWLANKITTINPYTNEK
jgi:hypothetical protein